MICEECKNTIYDQRGAATYGHKFDCSQAALEDQNICGALIHVGFEGATTCANEKPCLMHDYKLCQSSSDECSRADRVNISGTVFHYHPKNLMIAHTDGSKPHPITEPCETCKKVYAACTNLDCKCHEVGFSKDTHCMYCDPINQEKLFDLEQMLDIPMKDRHFNSKPSEPTKRWEIIPQSITYRLPAEEIHKARAEGAKIERARIRVIVESLKLRPDNSHIGEELRSKYNQALKAVIKALDWLTNEEPDS